MQKVLTSVCWLGDAVCNLQRSLKSCAGLSPDPAVPCLSSLMTSTDASPSPKLVAAQGLPEPEWHFVFNIPQWISHEFV